MTTDSQLHIDLPNLPSALLREAMKDLEAAENAPGVKIDMGWWHEPFGSICYVCLAGSVMRRALSDDTEYDPYDFDYGTRRKLTALDCLRVGDIRNALIHFGIHLEIVISDGVQDRQVTPYEESPAAFKREMAAIADYLESFGL